MSFKDHELLTVIRHIEQEGQGDLTSEISACASKIEEQLQFKATPFQQKAISRARQLADISGLGHRYNRASRRYRSVVILLYLIMVTFGFFAVQQTLAANRSELNVYWLLLVVIGINGISMLLWLIYLARGMLTKTSTVNQSPLLRIFKSAHQFLNRKSSQLTLFSAWSETYLIGRVGRWFASTQLHAAWLMYLLGAIIALLITLSGKQYDFVWGTTILSSSLFVSATELLGLLPNMVGFAVPSADQILASELGSERKSIESLRSIWANFVFGCILLYALLPRLLLWIFANFVLRRAKTKYQVNWEQPYFYSLRTKMLPRGSSIGVIDADTVRANKANSQTNPSDQLNISAPALQDLEIPNDIYIATFEWGTETKPNLAIDGAIDLGAIDSAHEQTGMLQALKQRPKPVVIMVPLERAADRGTARFLKDILKLAELQLIVVKREDTRSDSARLAGWQALIERIELPSAKFRLAELR